MKRLSIIVLSLLSSVLSLQAETALFLSDCSAMAGDTINVGLYISDSNTITAFQTDITLPANVTFVEANIELKAADHILLTNILANGAVRVGCWSTSNNTFADVSGRIATIRLAVAKTVWDGEYEVKTTKTALILPNGGRKRTKDFVAKIYVGSTQLPDGNAVMYSDYSITQAYYVQNANMSTLALQVQPNEGKVVIGRVDDTENGMFFLEPAFDAGEGFYYLRSVSGYYLNFSFYGSLARLGITTKPNKEAAVKLKETGQNQYSIANPTNGQLLGASSLTEGSAVSMKVDISNSIWQLVPSSAMWDAGCLKHMTETASTVFGLTQGSDDLELRMCVHQAMRCLEDKAKTETLVEQAEKLINAVAAARKGAADGDTSVANVPWGEAESLPATDFVICIESESGDPYFLADNNGLFMLTDTITVCSMSLQDMFYNPLTDLYAIRLAGNNGSDEGIYLSADLLSGTVSEKECTKDEKLRIWKVMTLNNAMEKYLVRSGNCGPTAKWRFDADTRTLFITGSERTAYYNSAESTPWSKYRHFINHAVLAGEFEKLGSFLFAGCTSLKRLSITAQNAPSLSTATFGSVQKGLQIYAIHPEKYTEFIEGCEVHNIASIQQTYVYNGKTQKATAVCDFETLVTANDMQKNAGSYSTIASVHIYIEGTTYTMSIPFDYTILPSPLTTTTRSYSRTYGTKNPNFYVVYTGYVGKDKETDVISGRPLATCEADKTSPVGDYVITLSGGALKNSNYYFVYQNSKLTISPARLIIIANSYTRTQDEPNPTFGCTYSGFVNDDDESIFVELPVFFTEANETSSPGTYDIFVSGGFAPNYDLHYITGTLTVTPGTEVYEPTVTDEAACVFDMKGHKIDLLGRSTAELNPGVYVVNKKKIWIKQ